MADNRVGGLRLPPELRQPLFMGGAVLYVFSCLNRYWAPWPPLPAFINSHLGDLLTLPLELSLLLWVMRRYYFRRPGFVLPTAWIISTWVVVAVWFELLLPLFKPEVVADPLDVVAYTVGGFVFWRWMNKPAPA